MKFGEQLEVGVYEPWRKHYFQYARLKRTIERCQLIAERASDQRAKIDNKRRKSISTSDQHSTSMWSNLLTPIKELVYKKPPSTILPSHQPSSGTSSLESTPLLHRKAPLPSYQSNTNTETHAATTSSAAMAIPTSSVRTTSLDLDPQASLKHPFFSEFIENLERVEAFFSQRVEALIETMAGAGCIEIDIHLHPPSAISKSTSHDLESVGLQSPATVTITHGSAAPSPSRTPLRSSNDITEEETPILPSSIPSPTMELPPESQPPYNFPNHYRPISEVQFRDWYVELAFLSVFADLNAAAARKIVKKFAKVMTSYRCSDPTKGFFSAHTQQNHPLHHNPSSSNPQDTTIIFEREGEYHHSWSVAEHLVYLYEFSHPADLEAAWVQWLRTHYSFARVALGLSRCVDEFSSGVLQENRKINLVVSPPKVTAILSAVKCSSSVCSICFRQCFQRSLPPIQPVLPSVENLRKRFVGGEDLASPVVANLRAELFLQSRQVILSSMPLSTLLKWDSWMHSRHLLSPSYLLLHPNYPHRREVAVAHPDLLSGELPEIEGNQGVQEEAQRHWEHLAHHPRLLHLLNLRQAALVTSVSWPGLFASLLAFFITLTLPKWLLPAEAAEDEAAPHCLALWVFATLLWQTEAMPYFATALLVPVLVVVLGVLRNDDINSGWHEPSVVVPVISGEAMNMSNSVAFVLNHFFGSATIQLLAAYTIQAALVSCQWDLRAAHLAQKCFGKYPRLFLAATMASAAFLTGMVGGLVAPVLILMVVLPVVKDLPTHSRYARCLLLSVGYGCSIGGMATPNASLQSHVAEVLLSEINEPISFNMWIAVTLPVVVTSIALGWGTLIAIARPYDLSSIPLVVYERRGGLHRRALAVLAITIGFLVFLACCVLLAMPEGCEVVASLVVMVILFGSGLLSEVELSGEWWSVLLVVAGTNVLGASLAQSGLLSNLANLVTSAALSPTTSTHYPFLATIVAITVAALFAALAPAPAAALAMPALAIPLLPPSQSTLAVTMAISCGGVCLSTATVANIQCLLTTDDLSRPYLRTKDFLRTGPVITFVLIALVSSFGCFLLRVYNL